MFEIRAGWFLVRSPAASAGRCFSLTNETPRCCLRPCGSIDQSEALSLLLGYACNATFRDVADSKRRSVLDEASGLISGHMTCLSQALGAELLDGLGGASEAGLGCDVIVPQIK